MPNPYGAPEINVYELKEKLAGTENFVLLDIREPRELNFAKMKDGLYDFLPMSRLARELTDALPASMDDKETEVIVMCHHGVRSAQVTMWLLQNGWKNTFSLSGGIDAYAKFIDPTVGLY